MAYAGGDGGAERRAEVGRGAGAAGAAEGGGGGAAMEETAAWPRGAGTDAEVCCGMAMRDDRGGSRATSATETAHTARKGGRARILWRGHRRWGVGKGVRVVCVVLQ